MKIEIHNMTINAQGDMKRAECDCDKDLPIMLDALRTDNDKLEGKNENQKSTINTLRREIQDLRNRLGSIDIPPNTVAADFHDAVVNKLKARRKELNQANTVLESRVEILVANKKQLEDKIAGYELGMSKAEVNKEVKPLDRSVDPKYLKPPKQNRLSQEEVWQVRRYFKEGRKNIWIQKHTGLDDAVVSRLRKGRSYINIKAEPKNAAKCLPTRWQKKPTTAHAGHGLVKQGKKK